jgi:putative transcriptional regulator
MTMNSHHPDDALLLAQVAGSQVSGHSLLVACHLEGCAHCRERADLLRAIGGAMLEDLPPAVLPTQALARTLAAIDRGLAAPARRAGPLIGQRPALPPGALWPRALRGCYAGGWRWIAPGTHWSRVMLPQGPDANVFLLRMAAGRESSFHGHSGSELTLVLHGAFAEGRERFAAGDFAEADSALQHIQKVEPDGECICLVSVEGRVLFRSALARLVGAVTRM